MTVITVQIRKRGPGTAGQTSLGTIAKERDEVRKVRMIIKAETME